MPPPKTGELLTTHSIFQELSDFFRTSEVLKVAKKEMRLQARQIFTTLFTASPTYTINSKFLQDVGFDPKKAPMTVLPAVESISKAEDSKLHSDQESSQAHGPQAMIVWYIQPCPNAIETGQGGKKCCPSLTKPSSSLSNCSAARVLHLPIDDAQADWLDCFFTNTDIPSDIHPKHQQCVVGQDAPKVFPCP